MPARGSYPARAASSSLVGLEKQKDTLTLRAPMAARIVDVASALHPGRWINEDLRLLTIIDPQRAELTGIIDAQNLSRIEKGQTAMILPAEPEIDEVGATVVSIEDTNVKNLINMQLASVYGGEVAVRRDKSGLLVPENSSYRISFHPEQQYPVNRILTGRIFIEAKSQSLIKHAYDTVAAVLIRETGF